jgi:hypothetical protein
MAAAERGPGLSRRPSLPVPAQSTPRPVAVPAQSTPRPGPGSVYAPAWPRLSLRPGPVPAQSTPRPGPGPVGIHINHYRFNTRVSRYRRPVPIYAPA